MKNGGKDGSGWVGNIFVCGLPFPSAASNVPAHRYLRFIERIDNLAYDQRPLQMARSARRIGNG